MDALIHEIANLEYVNQAFGVSARSTRGFVLFLKYLQFNICL